MITATNICKDFNNIVALKDVSIVIPQGTILGLLGPNGAGKTTFLRIITRILLPDSGEVLFGNKPLNKLSAGRIGYLPEERGLYSKMKVGELSIYLAILKGLTKEDAVIELTKWFSKLNINDWWDKRVGTLSKGMQQKLQFIISVVHKPDFLILDEPFSGLDPINVEILGNEILELNKNGTTIVFSTHNMNSVEQFCKNIVLINNGKIVLSGLVEDIKHTYRTLLYEFQFKKNPKLLEKYINSIGAKVVSIVSENNIYSMQALFGSEKDVESTLITNINNIQLIAFREVLPTMNDIFIRLIKL